MNYIRKNLLVVMGLILLSGPASALPFSSLIIFGDSLSDTGNISALTGIVGPSQIPLSPPYDPNRFSNGDVWVDTLSVMLGLGAVSPSFTGGTNYAWGGALTGAGGSPTDPPSLTAQSAGYLLDPTVGGTVDPTSSLFIVWGGGNNIRSGGALAASAAGELLSITQSLIDAGAQNILVPNLPDIGFTPEALFGLTPGCQTLADPGLQCSGLMSGLTADHNTALAAGLGGLVNPNGANVMLFDVASIFAMLLANPDPSGPTIAGIPCYQGSPFDTVPAPTCSNPDEYIFWDGIHPTAAAHEILGELAFSQVVPIPAAVWLFGSALFGLIGMRRRS